MTDRELLKAAAKAAKVSLLYPFGPGCGYVRHEGPWVSRDTSDRHGALRIWNPLTDDGDALRLAVKLRLCVDNCTGEYGDRHDVTVGEEAGMGVLLDEDHGADPYAATRRAIVRAAAAIDEIKK